MIWLVETAKRLTGSTPMKAKWSIIFVMFLFLWAQFFYWHPYMLTVTPLLTHHHRLCVKPTTSSHSRHPSPTEKDGGAKGEAVPRGPRRLGEMGQIRWVSHPGGVEMSTRCTCVHFTVHACVYVSTSLCMLVCMCRLHCVCLCVCMQAYFLVLGCEIIWFMYSCNMLKHIHTHMYTHDCICWMRAAWAKVVLKSWRTSTSECHLCSVWWAH